MRMDGVFSGLLGSAGQLAAGALPKLLVSSPIVVYGHVMVDDTAPLIALGIVWALDWLLGISRAIKNRNLSSRAFVSGIGKLLLYCALILVAQQTQIAVPLLSMIPSAVYAYIALTELTSVIENMEDLGLRVPLMHLLYRFLARRNLSDRDQPHGLEAALKALFKKEDKPEDFRQTRKIVKKLPTEKRSELRTLLRELDAEEDDAA